MFWRIVGAALSLTFFVGAFSIWGDPNCRSVTMHGGRFGIAYTCYGDSYGTSASGFAFFLFFVGAALLTFNLWPYIRVWLNLGQSAHRDSKPTIQATSALRAQAASTNTSKAGGQNINSSEYLRPANCEKCDKKLTKKSRFCANCGEEVRVKFANTLAEGKMTPHTKSPRQNIDEASLISSVKSRSTKTEEAKAFWGFALVGLILLVISVALVDSTQNSTTPSSESPVASTATYSGEEVVAAAGEGFQYVNNGFAVKFDESQSGCAVFSSCLKVNVFSSQECWRVDFSLSFLDNANVVVGKDLQRGDFGLVAGETGLYELKWLNGELVEVDDIKCLVTKYSG